MRETLRWPAYPRVKSVGDLLIFKNFFLVLKNDMRETYTLVVDVLEGHREMRCNVQGRPGFPGLTVIICDLSLPRRATGALWLARGSTARSLESYHV